MTPLPDARATAAGKRSALASMRDAVRLRAVSRRDPPAWSRPLLTLAIAIALSAHLLLAWWLRDLMQPTLVADNDRIDVHLIDAPTPEPALPDLPPPARPAESQTTAPGAVEAPARVHTTARLSATPAVVAPAFDAPLQVVDKLGSIILPKEGTDAFDTIARNAFIPQSTAPSRLMGPHRPLKIRPNHFARAWRAPENENLLGETLRKVGEFVDDNLTTKKEFTTPWGTKIKCQASFMFVMALGCGWGFPPPPGGRPTEHWKPATEIDEY